MEYKFIILFCLLCIPFAHADYIDNVYNFYTPDLEFGFCAKTNIDIDYKQTDFTWELDNYQFRKYGTKTAVNFRCNNYYNTLMHSHPTEYCTFSRVDMNFFRNSRHFKTSIVFCEKDYLVMTKINQEIKIKRYIND